MHSTPMTDAMLSPTKLSQRAHGHTVSGRLRVQTSIRSTLLALLAISSVLVGCAPVLIGGAAVGVATIHDRRPYYVVIDDEDIELSAMSVISGDPGLSSGSRIAVTSYNRKALLTGQADSEELANRAGDLVSRLQKVERVINEVAVGPAITLTQKSDDVVLTSRSKLALADIAMPGFDPTRVKVVTEDGVVYLMGLVSPAEADAATEKVRYVPGVKRVVRLFELDEDQS